MPRSTTLKRQTVADVVLSASLLAATILVVAAGTTVWLELSAGFRLRAPGLFLVVIPLIAWLAHRALAGRGFGLANRITLLRLALLALVTAALGETPSAALAWFVIGTTTLALVLDGFDGLAARRSNSESSFGARFDMETDAATILVLAILCWQFDKAGVWILAAGLMRYAFVLAAAVLPWMRRALPPSRRRQTVCILQSAGLLTALSPLFPSPASDVVAFAMLVMLTASFAIDVRWLWRCRAAGAVE